MNVYDIIFQRDKSNELSISKVRVVSVKRIKIKFYRFRLLKRASKPDVTFRKNKSNELS